MRNWDFLIVEHPKLGGLYHKPRHPAHVFRIKLNSPGLGDLAAVSANFVHESLN